MPVLGPVVTAMVTPFTEDRELDLEGAGRLARHLVDHGTDTVLVGGTTGESPTIHGEEAFEVLAAVDEAVGERAQVMLGTGTNDTAGTVAATERAVEEGADAVLVVTPYYNKPPQKGLVEHFAAAAEAAGGTPVLLYDIPGRSCREIALETLVELAGVDNIVGVKDATTDLAKAARILHQTNGAPGGFELYSGADEVNLPLLAVGGSGFVSVAAHLIGDDLAEMARVYPIDPGRARAIHQRSLPLQKALFAEPNPAPLKGALNRIGLPAGPVRPPLADAAGETVDAVMSALAPFGVKL